ncbi:INTS8 isoform 1, partial [Pongo abelii]
MLPSVQEAGGKLVFSAGRREHLRRGPRCQEISEMGTGKLKAQEINFAWVTTRTLRFAFTKILRPVATLDEVVSFSRWRTIREQGKPTRDPASCGAVSYGNREEAWFEDPAPVQLIVQFLEQASKPSVNEQNQVQPPPDNKRNRILKLLALKVAAHLKWDLDILEKSLSVPVLNMLLNELLCISKVPPGTKHVDMDL